MIHNSFYLYIGDINMIQFLTIFLSTLAYFLPLLNFSPLKFSRKQKTILFLLILSNITLILFYLKNIGVLVLLTTVCLYLCYIDKHRLQSICAFLVTYLFCVLCDNIILLVWTSTGFQPAFIRNTPYFYILYLVIYNILLYFISLFLGYFVKKLIFKDDFFISKEGWLFVTINIFLSVLIFAFNVIIWERIGYTKTIVTFNCILFALYFLLSTLLTINTLKSYKIRSELKAKQTAYDNLQRYTDEIEALYSELRSFKHDYVNVLLSMKGYIESNDIEGLSNYFDTEILSLNHKINQGDYKLNQLINLQIIELKSVISAKMIYAHEHGIDVSIEIMDPITHIDMDIVDLSRIIGIFLDNAIEAVLETTQPRLFLTIIANPDSTTILIKNNFVDHQIPCYEMSKPHVSTKGENRGIGLYNASMIVSEYDNILLDTQIQEDIFSQRLEICYLS